MVVLPEPGSAARMTELCFSRLLLISGRIELMGRFGRVSLIIQVMIPLLFTLLNPLLQGRRGRAEGISNYGNGRFGINCDPDAVH